MDYRKQIRSPLWQRKRLSVMQDDDFTCQICGEMNKTLIVHHIRYIKGRKIWEYPNSLLITLCEDCHDFVHERGRWEWIREYERLMKINILI